MEFWFGSLTGKRESKEASTIFFEIRISMENSYGMISAKSD